MIFVLPNAIARVLVTLELNIPHANPKPPKSSVPLVSVKVLVAVSVVADANVVVPDTLLTVRFVSVVLVAVSTLPVPAITAVKLAYETAAANVKLLRYTVVTAGTLVLPVKANVSKKLPVVNVGIDAPLVSASLGGVNTLPFTVVTGVVAAAVAVATLVTVYALILLSNKKLALFGVFSNKLVCEYVTALMLVPELCEGVSVLMGGVKLPVYTATPLVTRRLEILPANGLLEPSTALPMPKLLLAVLLMVKLIVIGVCATPFTYAVNVLPLRTRAK